MSDRNNDSEKIPAALKKPAAFRVVPITASGSLDDYIADAEALYTECEEAFLASDVRAEEFPKVCETWAVTARTLIMGAAALFGRYRADQKNKRRALELFERCKTGSGLRAKNLKLHYDLAKQDTDTLQEILDQNAGWRWRG